MTFFKKPGIFESMRVFFKITDKLYINPVNRLLLMNLSVSNNPNVRSSFLDFQEVGEEEKK